MAMVKISKSAVCVSLKNKVVIKVGSWNGLIYFALFLLEKINLDFEQFRVRAASWNKLVSKYEALP